VSVSFNSLEICIDTLLYNGFICFVKSIIGVYHLTKIFIFVCFSLISLLAINKFLLIESLLRISCLRFFSFSRLAGGTALAAGVEQCCQN
jgi:hypothetical protein